ncbi:M12 family metallo-peptidase [Flavobacterium subsaxonicum]|uniref:Peptidase M12B domain-containing protein n=1 Tax=Flavobacterium subsaxonicum WB 4.1-42 = DSM 21790 TaxID=1121898 RepID=A0A0A2MT03_9FLAO|nr:M12 family metallo-peptidase [Flavobacterium subsaxonicum]KGO91365.1 hypothetical protein Q766_18260 [Flavobacterium subsaxonicum WB 4.1-42 = DSM 21790]
MKNVLLYTAVILFFTSNVFAQKYVSKLVEKQFEIHGQAKQVTNLLLEDRAYTNPNATKIAKNGVFYTIDANVANSLVAANLPVLSLEIVLKGTTVTLDLANAESTFEDAVVTTTGSDKLSIQDLKQVYYRGVIRGQENSLVAITISDKEVSGFISNEQGNFIVGKLQTSAEHVIYPDTDLRGHLQYSCSTDDAAGESHNHNGMQNKNAEVTEETLLSKCVKLSYETEYDIYQQLGSSSAVLAYVTTVHNQAATLYYNEGILTPLSGVTIWTSTDPYTATSTVNLLTQYQANTSSLGGNLSQLLTFRNVGGGIAAGFDGICNSNIDNSLATSMIYSYLNALPTYSWTVYVVTHEFGHLFGSRHTHACVWNGNNTAIDGCSGYTEGGCTVPAIPTDGGTIMSYCHLTTAGINFYKGFGLQPGNVIRSDVNNGACLVVCTNCTQELTIFIPVVESHDYRVQNSITASSVVNGGLIVGYYGNQILLKEGFSATGNGGTFLAQINPCVLYTYRTSSDDSNAEFSATDVLAINTAKTFQLSPNPASQLVTITSSKTIALVVVTSVEGRVMLNKQSAKSAATSLDINVDNYTQGYYTVTVTFSDGTMETQKLIKN